jgi:hypothetical protein
MRMMASCIERSAREMVILAPAAPEAAHHFHALDTDPGRHRHLLNRAQALRGRTYLADGAIDERQLTSDGRHVQAIDDESWHILALDECGDVCGCVRYRHHWRTSFREMGVSHSALASSPIWGQLLAIAVTRELASTRRQGMAYGEVGAWAISPARRCSAEALRIALSAYALARALGGACGITTATVRHHSSTILRKIGGRPLDVDGASLPAYYDPQYRCEMEILRFDSRFPSEPFRSPVDQLGEAIVSAPVICARAPRANAASAPWRCRGVVAPFAPADEAAIGVGMS